MQVLKMIANDFIMMVRTAFRDMSYYIYAAIRLLVPYGMFFVGMAANGVDNQWFNSFWLWVLMLVPLLLEFVLYFLKAYANRIGKGTAVPAPIKRFTECGSEGEVSVENSRLQEMLLYVADLEDWLEKRGLL